MDSKELPIELLIAIPAYNEEKEIPQLLGLLKPWKKDVVVIDDGSTDQTAKCVIEHGFHCISLGSNQGLGSVYSTVKRYAVEKGYTHILAIDADGQHDTVHIPEFAEKLKQFDLVCGNRFHMTSELSERKIASNLFAILLFKEFLNIKLPDAACGFMAMKLDVIPDDSSISRFEIIYELRARHALSGKECGFVPIAAIYHPDDPLNTDILEIRGLIKTVSRYHSSKDLISIMESINNGSDFSITISGFRFEAKFNGSDAYHFSTDIQRARDYFTSINSLNNK
jgi:glycosyltransferase involved in cell wall biosynthesis